MISEHTIILLVYAAAMLPALRCIRTSRCARAWLLAAPPIAVYLVSSLVFAVPLSAMLEAPYFQRAFPAAEGEAIVVLTSKVYDSDVERPLPLAGEDT